MKKNDTWKTPGMVRLANLTVKFDVKEGTSENQITRDIRTINDLPVEEVVRKAVQAAVNLDIDPGIKVTVEA
jgi:hypothetical protein